MDSMDRSLGEEHQQVMPVTDVSLAVGLTRAEVDQQIATAKRYPRSLHGAITNITSMATLDEETSEECMYSVPRDGKQIEGPSARFAEIVLQNWGNCRVAARVVREDKDYIVAQAVFHDLETNSAVSTEVQRRIMTKNGRRYGSDMIVNTGNAACSIARRNIILAGVPKAIWRRAYQDARKVVMGDFKTLSNRRAGALQEFQKYGVEPARIFAALDVKGEEDVSLEHIVALRGMLATLRNGESTPEEMFGASTKEKAPVGNPLMEASQLSQPLGDGNVSSVVGNASQAAGEQKDDGQQVSRAQSETAGATVPAVSAETIRDYSAALTRGSQPKSLPTLGKSYWEKNTRPTDAPSLKKIEAVYNIHLRRVAGELTIEQIAAEIEKVIAG
jgi:hypothetical protein